MFFPQFLPFSGDKMLITGSEDGEVRLHDLTTFDTTQVGAAIRQNWGGEGGPLYQTVTYREQPYIKRLLTPLDMKLG